MKTTKALPVIRVERPKAGAVKSHVPSSDIGTMDLMLAIVTAGNRVRSRVDGLAGRGENRFGQRIQPTIIAMRE